MKSGDSVYRCPGEAYSISRAVHLGRLADFYPACRECPRRDDTLGLSARTVRRVSEAHATSPQRPRSAAEGSEAFAINDLSPPKARTIAIEFVRNVLISRSEMCTLPIIFGSDGRLVTAAVAAAMIEGIRWTGCEAIDLGPVSVPCLATALRSSSAAGGIYLGNPSGAAHTLGLKFWVGKERMSQNDASAALAAIDRSTPAPVDRAVRTFGPLRREDAATAYLDELRPAYHALRSLRFALWSSCEPVWPYLDELTRNVACRAIRPHAGKPLGEQILAARAHFGIEISDDGENANVFDERGSLVSIESLARLWRAADCEPVADALRTLTALLVLLSRSDEPFSAVLNS